MQRAVALTWFPMTGITRVSSLTHIHTNLTPSVSFLFPQSLSSLLCYSSLFATNAEWTSPASHVLQSHLCSPVFDSDCASKSHTGKSACYSGCRCVSATPQISKTCVAIQIDSHTAHPVNLYYYHPFFKCDSASLCSCSRCLFFLLLAHIPILHKSLFNTKLSKCKSALEDKIIEIALQTHIVHIAPCAVVCCCMISAL